MRRLMPSGYCLALTVLAGCAGTKTKEPVVSSTGGGKTTSESGSAAAQRGKSLIRFVNAVPDLGLDLTTEDRATFINVAFKEVTPYTEIGDNLVKFRVRANDGDSVLAENSETMGDGLRYTVLAMPSEDGKVKLRVVRDDLVPEPGKARIRVIQAAPAIPEVNIALAGQKDPVFDKVKYGAEAGYKDVSPVLATLEFRMGNPPRVTVPFRIKAMNLAAGRAYTLVIVEGRPRGIQTIAFNDAVRH
ncbi:MAG TPA: DUF4397 domain-containing protein [Gemmatimonadales bacterium]|nr:DUF4397 domain-containing protein [Gemmatimonadales bacterium]